jgi:aerobic carbon-monoxide dehydrogenase large subunit
MADEAYRAVFLRIHPTGGMVLSLTTEADGNEPSYRQQVADQLGVPALDVKVVAADTDRFGEGHGFGTTPSGGLPEAITSTTGKILVKARLLAGAALQEPAEQLQWSDGAFRTTTDPAKAATIADVAMYSLSSGELPPGVEGGLDAQTVYRD